MTEINEMVLKREQILELIREILVTNKIDAKDVITIAEELKVDSIVSICLAVSKEE